MKFLESTNFLLLFIVDRCNKYSCKKQRVDCVRVESVTNSREACGNTVCNPDNNKKILITGVSRFCLLSLIFNINIFLPLKNSVHYEDRINSKLPKEA